MRHNLSIIIIAVVCAMSLSTCKQQSTGPNDGLSNNVVTSPAHPALTYYGAFSNNGTTYSAVYVMDTDGSHQIPIYVAPSSSIKLSSAPSWSPDGGSICFTEHDTLPGSYQIKSIALPVNPSVMSATNNARTIYSYTDPSTTLSNAVWSSTKAVGEIAYTTQGWSGGTQSTNLCVVPQAGGNPTTIWTLPGDVQLGYCTWSPDDSRLAVYRINGSFDGTIMIFNTATRAYVDSIEVFGVLSGLEWSRSGLNKLAFSMQTYYNGKWYLYYCDPTTGAVPTTQGVIGGYPTWSPNNSSIAYWSANGISKFTVFTSLSSVISPAIATIVKWKR